MYHSDSAGESGFVLFVFRSLVDEIHELVELRSDDDLCAAVALLAHFRAVGCNGVVLATTTGSEAFRIYTILVLQCLHYA